MKMSIIVFITTILFNLVPLISYAQGGIVTCDGTSRTIDCGTCELIAMGNNVINFIIRFMLVFIAIIFAYAGYRLVMSRGSTSEYEAAKRMLSNIIIGLIILLIAWLAVDTIMKLLLRNDGQVQYDSAGTIFGPWNSIECTRSVPLIDGQATRLGTTQYPDAIETTVSTVSLACTPLPSGDYNCASQIDSCQARGGVPGEGVSRSTISCQFVNQVNQAGVTTVECTPLPSGDYNCAPQTSACEAGGGVVLEGTRRGTIRCAAGSSVVPTSGSCSASFLSTYFPGEVNIAACVAGGESGCGASFYSTTDRTADGNAFSMGMWQQNLSVWTVEGCGPTLNCPAAFSGTNYNATVVDIDLYNQCANALRNAECASTNARRIRDTQGWTAWSYYNSSCR